MRYLQPIQETSYLTAVNAPQYRRVMRIFYNEYEKMHFQLYKEDVFEIITRHVEYEDYTMDQLKSDLENLVNWKNLTPIQDPKRVYTIADYKNKQFRYSMSEYAVEIERLTVKLENLFMESGSLPTNLFARINGALEQADDMERKSLKEINEWWHNLQEDFKRLNQNYQDYLREFYSGRAEKVLKSLDFIQHKDLFISYLKDFIKELQFNATRIEATLKKVSMPIEEKLLALVIQSELEIPHPISEHQDSLESYIRENIYGKWQALKNWFLPHDGRPSECSQVMEITDEVIRKIIQNAALIVQLQNWGISRKDDYKKFISLFLNCGNLSEAHKLAAHVFGIQNVRHYKVRGERSTDSINSSTYDEEPTEYILKPHTRAYHPRVDRDGFENKAMQKLAQRNIYLQQTEEERKMVMKYIKDNRLDISAIDECISE
ncbi:MAG TPA: TIGR02677 family protein, partial [Anaerovoracaceae bacterium]|nr:TIGR02677 family protein [Anaerovoracaceae bacterium]